MAKSRNAFTAALLSALLLAGAAQARPRAVEEPSPRGLAARQAIVSILEDQAQARLAQRSPANTSSVVQQGEDNAGAVRQLGTGNEAAIRQFGSGNSGTITQTGNDNTACLIQVGRNVSGDLTQVGDGQRVGVVQTPSGARRVPVQACTQRPGLVALLVVGAEARRRR